MMRLSRHPSRTWFAGIVLALSTACATVPPAAPVANAYPDVPRLVVPLSLTPSDDVRRRHDAAWQRLQAGDLRAAGREFTEALRRDPSFFPAEAGLGYVASLDRRYDEAVTHFDTAIGLDATYVPALLGRMDVALVTGDEAGALAVSELILAADPSREDIRGQQDVLRLQVIQARLARAASARTAGQWDQAQAELNQALTMAPESAVVLRELALVEIARGAFDEAETHVRRSLELDEGDAETHAVLATVLEAHGRLRDAAAAFSRAAAIDPRPEWRERAAALISRAEFESLPAEFQAIPSASHVTRGQLAALLGIRLQTALTRAPRRVTVVLTDIRGHWASSWILPVIRAGWMEAFANHTFQPAADLRRADLATAAWRVALDVMANRPAEVARWREASPALSDVPPTHLAYAAIVGALSSGIMGLGDQERFQPNRLVSGSEVIAAVARLEQMTGGGGDR